MVGYVAHAMAGCVARTMAYYVARTVVGRVLNRAGPWPAVWPDTPARRTALLRDALKVA